MTDSGPTAKFVPSAFRLYGEDDTYQPLPLRLLTTPLLSLFWSPHLHRDLHSHLEKFPPGFPVFTVIGGRDPLIPPEDIEAVFTPHSNLRWRKLDLPEAGHLTALRDFSDQYSPALLDFFSSCLSGTCYPK